MLPAKKNAVAAANGATCTQFNRQLHFLLNVYAVSKGKGSRERQLRYTNICQFPKLNVIAQSQDLQCRAAVSVRAGCSPF